MNTSESYGRREQHFGIGAVQSHLLTMLNEYSEMEFATSIAERSPLGPRAIRICSVGDSDSSRTLASENLSLWLASQPWVEAVIARGQHVYLRVATKMLCSWVTAGEVLAENRHQCRAQGNVMRIAQSGRTQKGSLDEFREASVRRAVTALLTSRGYEVQLEPGVLIDRGATASEAARQEARGVSPDGANLLSRADSPALIELHVSGVDVRQGRLRARHGGTVSAKDLLGEIEEELLTKYNNNFAIVDSASLRKECAEQLLTFLLLRVERTQRVQLDDLKLRSESTAFESVLDARRYAAGAIPPREVANAQSPANVAKGGRAVADFALEIDLLPLVASRALNEFEPALIARYVRSLAERVYAASPCLPETEPLWQAAGRAIDTALALIGIHVPPEVWRPTPPLTRAHWAGLAGPAPLNERNQP